MYVIACLIFSFKGVENGSVQTKAQLLYQSLNKETAVSLEYSFGVLLSIKQC